MPAMFLPTVLVADEEHMVTETTDDDDEAVDPWPRALHGLRPSTLQLFGIRLAQLRGESDLDFVALADKSGRRAPWHMAVERGELVPTPRELIKLDMAYGSPTPSIREILTNLDAEPWSDEAIGLRARYALESPKPSGTLDDEDGVDSVFPILDEINRYDRLFVLGPIVLLAVLLATLLSLRPFSKAGPTFVWPDLEPYVLLASFMVGFTALATPGLGLLFVSASKLIRRTTRLVVDWDRPLSDVEKMRKADGIRSSGHTLWFQPSELQHMPLASRPTLRGTGVRAELADRIGAVLVLITVLTLGLGIYATIADDPPASADATASGSQELEPGVATPVTEPTEDWMWWFIAGGSGLMAVGSFAAAQGAARRFALHLGVGLGIIEEAELVDGQLPVVVS